ncbi:GDP-mannose 4,6-dehydratase [Paenibacillus dendritiformis]|uniref:GDP-mannose 4,6-dehydratase n=1 Tax=Paenibacillus dendritiformis TaxID=130049 RepID=UPI00248AE972|nr:GDP-mannose 4,6-dehydratase [Paenibacillus dendritiformis]WGU93807.1 GDP-mannose 4,6-dehydratase [Paenibacillus dendritiformis]
MIVSLITGINGFVGRYLGAHLKKKGHYVIGTSRKSEVHYEACGYADEVIVIKDLSSYEEVRPILLKKYPDYIFHLAALSNVARAWEFPEEAFQSNVLTTVNLLNVAKEFPKARILTVGSSEEYGYSADMTFPLKESSVTNPMNPYGLSKLNVSYLARQYHKAYGIDVVHVRPFNHIGPGQKEGFVVPDFASQIADIERGKKAPILKVGNLNAYRDFTDVRDVVDAYEKLASKGVGGEIYNVCSSRPIAITDVLNILVSYSEIKVEIVQDPNRYRPVEIPFYYGDNSKITNSIPWKPEHSIEESLLEILNEKRASSKKMV